VEWGTGKEKGEQTDVFGRFDGGLAAIFFLHDDAAPKRLMAAETLQVTRNPRRPPKSSYSSNLRFDFRFRSFSKKEKASPAPVSKEKKNLARSERESRFEKLARLEKEGQGFPLTLLSLPLVQQLATARHCKIV